MARTFEIDAGTDFSVGDLIAAVGPQAAARVITEWSAAAVHGDDRDPIIHWLRSAFSDGEASRLSPVVASSLLHAAAETGADLALAGIEPLAHSPHRTVRLAMAQNLPLAVRERETVGTVSVLEALAADSSPVVREWAVFGLAQQVYPARTRRHTVVRQALDDPSPAVRREARKGLAKFAWSATGDPVRDISSLATADDR
jgi:hypothetical protein